MYSIRMRSTFALVVMAASLGGMAWAGSVGATPTSANTNPSVLNGVYRIAWSEQELVAAGTTGHYAHENCPGRCVLTMTMRDGRFLTHWSPPPNCPGSYTVSGNTVSLEAQPPACHGHTVAKWSIHNGQLRLRVSLATDGGDKVLLGGKPWKKIG
jgi:hypothetical protein